MNIAVLQANNPLEKHSEHRPLPIKESFKKFLHLDHHQNLMASFLDQAQPTLKILVKSACSFLRNLTNNPTDN